MLAHPNTRLFFTHCGMHGVMEAIYHAVPMVGLPVFSDQGDNLVRMREAGIAAGLDKFATAAEIHAAVVEVLETPGYGENVRRMSEIMRARQTRPMDDAVWLLEMVARTSGAEHLKVGSRRLNLVQFYCLDCLVVMGLLLAGVAWAGRRLVRRAATIGRTPRKEKLN